VALVGLMIAVHHLTQLRTLTKLHCDIAGDADARNLHIVGVSHSRTERSISTGGKIPVPLRTAALKHPSSRVSLPTRRMVDAGIPGSRSTSDRFFFLLGCFPASDPSYFYTFSVDGSGSLSLECSDPMKIDTRGPNCSVVLPQGAVAYCGTTAGTLIRWNIRSLLRVLLVFWHRYFYMLELYCLFI